MTYLLYAYVVFVILILVVLMVISAKARTTSWKMFGHQVHAPILKFIVLALIAAVTPLYIAFHMLLRLFGFQGVTHPVPGTRRQEFTIGIDRRSFKKRI